MLRVIDVETTGLFPDAQNDKGDRITAIAIVTVDELFNVVHRWSSFVNPHRNIPKRVTELTGIDAATVADAPAFNDLRDVVLQAVNGSVLIGYNIRFDIQFLANELGCDPDDFQKVCLYAAVRRHEGTHSAAKRTAGGSLRLSDVHRRYCGEAPDLTPHRALDDAVMTAQLLPPFHARGWTTWPRTASRVRTSARLARQLASHPARTLNGQRVAFTGTLQSMTRLEAIDLAYAHGGSTGGVVKSTRFLVDPTDGTSVKRRKAEQYNIVVLNESEFLNVVHGTAPVPRPAMVDAPMPATGIVEEDANEAQANDDEEFIYDFGLLFQQALYDGEFTADEMQTLAQRAHVRPDLWPRCFNLALSIIVTLLTAMAEDGRIDTAEQKLIDDLKQFWGAPMANAIDASLAALIPRAQSDTPPAWHPDPSGQGRLRWWDGTAWTAHTHN